MRIGHNANSFLAHANMQRADRRTAVSARRLSSGIKINRSMDDPAGMAISSRMLMQASGTAQASHNSSNIISALHTADGALNEIHSMLGRIQTLAVAAANDTNVLEDKAIIQQEIDQIIQEINETSRKTEFNTLKLVGGEAGRIILTHGTQHLLNVVATNYTFPLGTLSFDLDDLPTRTTLVTGAGDPLPNPALHGRFITINGVMLTLHENSSTADLRQNLATVLSASGFKLSEAPAPSLLGTIQAVYSGSRHILEISGEPQILAALGLDTIPIPGTDAVINNIEGVVAPGAAYTSDGNLVTIVDADGNHIRLELREGISAGSHEITTMPGAMLAQTGANANINLYMEIPRVSAQFLGVDRINVQSPHLVQEAIANAYNAITVASEVRARIGSYINRLEHIVTNLDVAEVDTRHSISRIRDTDMALEMAEYSKDQVIYQAGMAILAQSNARPQQILQLLQ